MRNTEKPFHQRIENPSTPMKDTWCICYAIYENNNKDMQAIKLDGRGL